jgi:hypothetical protein
MDNAQNCDTYIVRAFIVSILLCWVLYNLNHWTIIIRADVSLPLPEDERDSVSKTMCFLVFRMRNDGHEFNSGNALIP